MNYFHPHRPYRQNRPTWNRRSFVENAHALDLNYHNGQCSPYFVLNRLIVIINWEYSIGSHDFDLVLDEPRIEIVFVFVELQLLKNERI